jgi:hypothetical protein
VLVAAALGMLDVGDVEAAKTLLRETLRRADHVALADDEDAGE